jgi:hypothetical protein
MNAYLIDPVEKTVTQVDHSGDYKEIQKAIGCGLFTCAYPPGVGADVIYVDDEGLFVEGQSFFKFEGYPHPLAGKGLVLGTTGEGDSKSPDTALETIKAKVRF